MLSHILQNYSDELECDFAEYYHIYDYKSLPPTKVALFFNGLRESARVKMKITNQKATFEQFLLASIVDRLSLLWWAKTEDGQKGINKPLMITEIISKDETPQEANKFVFSSGEEFEKFRRTFLKKET